MRRSAQPTVDAAAQRFVDNGAFCAECSAAFVKPHGHKVVCDYCARRMTTQEMADAGVRVATHEELNKAAHAELARERRTIKQARQERLNREAAGVLTGEGMQVYTKQQAEKDK